VADERPMLVDGWERATRGSGGPEDWNAGSRDCEVENTVPWLGFAESWSWQLADDIVGLVLVDVEAGQIECVF